MKTVDKMQRMIDDLSHIIEAERVGDTKTVESLHDSVVKQGETILEHLDSMALDDLVDSIRIKLNRDEI